jgi:cell division protein FtsB
VTNQPAFLLKTKSMFDRRTPLILQTDKLHPRYLEIRVTRPMGVVGGMLFQESVRTGKIDKNTFEFLGVKNHGFRFAATAAGVKAVLRRLRPQEASRLNEIDAEVELLKARIKELGQERQLVLREAFERGHVVTVAELRQAAEDKSALEETVEA